ncbi:MAG: M1 family aminopeptidase [Chloroflexota bacterium]
MNQATALIRHAWLSRLVIAMLVLAPVRPSVAAAPEPAATQPTYRLEVAIDVGRAVATVAQTVELPNRTGVSLGTLVFRSMPAAIGALDLKRASVDGVNVTPVVDGAIIEVPLPVPMPAEGRRTATLEYELRVPRRADRFGAQPGSVVLGSFVALLAIHEGDWDRRPYTEVGDAFYSENASWDVTVRTSAPTTIVTSGRPTGDPDRARFTASAARDFAIVAGQDLQEAATQASGTEIRAFARSAPRAQRLADESAAVFDWLAGYAGPTGQDWLAVVDVDLPASYGGMEYPGLVMISQHLPIQANLEGSTLGVLLVHEIAHQWFFGLVGNDQIGAPWVDEAFASYAQYLYYAERGSAAAGPVLDRAVSSGAGWSGPPVDGSVFDFPSDPAYFAVVYRGGATFLHALRRDLGPVAFRELLRSLVATYRGHEATPLGVLDLAQRHSGRPVRTLAAEYFRYPSLASPAFANWQVALSGESLRDGSEATVSSELPWAQAELWLDHRLIARGSTSPLRVSLANVEPGDYVLLARLTDTEGATFEQARRVTVGR